METLCDTAVELPQHLLEAIFSLLEPSDLLTCAGSAFPCLAASLPARHQRSRLLWPCWTLPPSQSHTRLPVHSCSVSTAWRMAAGQDSPWRAARMRNFPGMAEATVAVLLQRAAPASQQAQQQAAGQRALQTSEGAERSVYKWLAQAHTCDRCGQVWHADAAPFARPIPGCQPLAGPRWPPALLRMLRSRQYAAAASGSKHRRAAACSTTPVPRRAYAATRCSAHEPPNASRLA